MRFYVFIASNIALLLKVSVAPCAAQQLGVLIASVVLTDFKAHAAHDDAAFVQRDITAEDAGFAAVFVAQVIGFNIHGLGLVGLARKSGRTGEQQAKN